MTDQARLLQGLCVSAEDDGFRSYPNQCVVSKRGD
jgi:hypothetical protein